MHRYQIKCSRQSHVMNADLVRLSGLTPCIPDDGGQAHITLLHWPQRMWFSRQCLTARKMMSLAAATSAAPSANMASPTVCTPRDASVLRLSGLRKLAIMLSGVHTPAAMNAFMRASPICISRTQVTFQESRGSTHQLIHEYCCRGCQVRHYHRVPSAQ